MTHVPLGKIITPAETIHAGTAQLPLLSMTMHHGLVKPEEKFKKRVASDDTSGYKVVKNGQLVVGFPIDEGVLSFQRIYPAAIVSPAYGIWNLSSDKINMRYLELFLKSPTAIAYYRGKLRSTTARRRSLSKESFLALPVPLPPLEEQKRIAGILDQADALRRLRARALEKLNTLGQAVFQEMFGDGPESTYKLSEICELINGDRSSNYPSGEDIKESGILFLSTKNIQNWTLNYDKSQFITEDKFRSLSRGKLIRGDIVITLRGTLGQAAIFDGPYETGFINAQMMILRPFQQVTSEYLLDFLRHPSTQSELLKGQSGSAVKQLTAGRIGELSVQIPSPQRSISYRENTVQLQRIIVDAHDAKSKSDALFASLQSAAFQGKL